MNADSHADAAAQPGEPERGDSLRVVSIAVERRGVWWTIGRDASRLQPGDHFRMTVEGTY